MEEAFRMRHDIKKINKAVKMSKTMSTRQIAKRLKVSHVAVSRWLIGFKEKKKDTRLGGASPGLASRG